MQRIGDRRVVHHCLGRGEDTLHRDRLVDVSVRILHRVVMILDRHHCQVLACHTVAFHVQPGEHPRERRKRHPVYVLRLGVREACYKVGRFEAVDLSHLLDASNEDDVGHPRGDRLIAHLERGSA